MTSDDLRIRLYILCLSALAAISIWYLHGLRMALVVFVAIPAISESATFLGSAFRKRAATKF
jgi:hypothetical protein